MTKRSIARPTGGMSSRRRRHLSDYGGSNSWEGSKDSINILHKVYRGRFDRSEKYRMYEWMDEDSDISRALDLIAEHCTEHDEDNRYFQFDWNTDEPTAELSGVLKSHLDKWTKDNEMELRLFNVVRNTLKYGDWFMFRNPYTFELMDLHPADVLSAIVDQNTMDILGWVVRDFIFNIEDMAIETDNKGGDPGGTPFNQNGIGNGTGQNTRAIPAIHILHFSMSTGKMATDSKTGTGQSIWPFGNSWLDKASRTFRNRELLEDAAIIHRVQRAPSRHVWYVDTGKMRHDRAKYAVQNFKNELNEKRIPTFIGDNNKTVDSVYNPLSQLEDYYIPVSMDQRGSKVEQLEGTPWQDMPDLDYFSKKMMSALRVPYAWLLPSGDGGITSSDGRTGQATQEEIEFSRFCSRIHKFLIREFNHEFKLYARNRDVNANWADFDLLFIPPTDYEASRDRARLDAATNTFKGLADVPFISKRLLLKKALGWSDDLIAENERMLDEENNRDEATDAFDSMGMGGGMPLDAGMDPGMGLEANTDGIGGMGGIDGGNMGGDAMGGGDLGGAMGGAMESVFNDDFSEFINEADLKLPHLRNDMSDVGRVPNDPTINGADPVKGKPIATLSMIQRIRHAHFSKRVDQQKRLKMLNRIYSPAAADDGMGGPPGLGGPL